MPLKPAALIGWLLLYALMALLPIAVAMGIDRPEPRSFLVEAGALLGMLGLGMLAAQLVITGRHRWFAGKVGLDNLLQFHRRTGLFAWCVILLHPGLLMLGDTGFISWLDPREELLRALGVWALFIVLSVILISSLWRAQLKLSYELWRSLHALGALFVVAGGLGHALMGAHHTAGLLTQLVFILIIVVPLGLLLETRLWRPWRLQRFPWRVVEVASKRSDCVQLVLEAEGHAGMSFKPGQFAWLSLGSPFAIAQNPFSMTCSPDTPTRLEFVMKQVGDFTESVSKAKKGTQVYVEGPYGIFTLPETGRRLVFIVGGIGITPVLSMLRTRLLQQDKSPILLIYANQTPDDIVMQQPLEAMTEKLSLTLLHVVSVPDKTWQGETGYVDADLLAKYLPEDAADIDYFVCGPPPMMDIVEPELKKRGVDNSRLFSERFDLV